MNSTGYSVRIPINMSKLIETLERTTDYTSTPLGFGAASRNQDSPASMALIGMVSSEDLAKRPKLAEAPVDAILVSVKPWGLRALSKLTKSPLADRLWGVHLTETDGTQAKEIKKKGCDFILFNPDSTPASLLNDHDLGMLIPVGPDLSEDAARAIQDLPIDAVLFLPEQDLLPLTVQKLIDIQVVRGLLDKPFLLAVPANLEPADLESLRNLGIAGLALDLSSTQDIARTKKAIANLPRRKSTPTSSHVVAPQASHGLGHPDHDGDEEDQDDDF